MKWILLWTLFGAENDSGGPATAEFNNREACEYALQKAEDLERFGAGTRAVCVPKGEE